MAPRTLTDQAPADTAPAYQPCPSCGHSEARVLLNGTDRLFRTTDRRFQVIECNGCRLMRLHPWPKPDELHAYYPETYWFVEEQGGAHGFTSRLEQSYRRFVLGDHLRFVEKVLREGRAKGSILDVGCGGGLFLHMLAERGATRRYGPVAGLDFALDAARAAWKRLGVPAVCGSLSSAPFPPESCAAITMFHVLEHLYDPAAYLRAAHDLLAPDGRLIVQVPNAACWQFLLLGTNWSGIDIPRHLIDFRSSDLERLLDHCGFEVIRKKYFSLRDAPAGLATSLAPSLDPMARRLRKVEETPAAALAKDAIYLALVLASLPPTLLEAACRAGNTVMIAARKKRV